MENHIRSMSNDELAYLHLKIHAIWRRSHSLSIKNLHFLVSLELIRRKIPHPPATFSGKYDDLDVIMRMEFDKLLIFTLI